MKSISIFLMIFAFVLSAETVRVGAYDNPPKIFKNGNGEIEGFWADVTNEIAQREGWNIEWIFGTWDECLSRLEKGELDIMVDTGLTPSRELKYRFAHETVHLSWTSIFKHPDSNIESVLDLSGKKIGGLKNSFDLEGPQGLKKVLKDFEIPAEIVELGDYKDILAKVERGELDAGIVDKDFGNLSGQNFKINQTPIVLQPAKMMYSFNKESERSDRLISSIDKVVKQMKSDENSVYYRSFDHFLGSPQKKFVLPAWLWIALSVMGAAIVLLTGMEIYLKREVNKKTLSLKESEQNLRITLESIGDGVIATDAEGKITMINKTAEKLTGWAHKECAGKPMNDIFRILNAHTREKVDNPADIVIKNGKTVGLANDTVLISKSGTEYQIADSAAPIVDPNGNIHGVILVFSDVSEKYKAEEQRKTSERSFRSIVESSPLGIYLYELDENNDLILAGYNPAADKIIGISHEKLKGKKIEDAFPMLSKTEVPLRYRKAASEGATWHNENFSYDYQGIKGCYNIVAFGISNNKMAVMFYDISDLKAAHEEIKKLNESLEKKVAIRTRELELSNKELESFAYSVSHDLRAPLRHINGFAASMEEVCHNCGKEALSYLKKISVSSLEMGVLIDDLLEYSKTGRADLVKKQTDMNELVIELKERLYKEEIYPKAQFHFEKLPAVLCDESLMRTVWLNLIENALKYSSKTSEPVISIGCKDKEKEYEFYIKDNGAGFDPAFSGKLFGVFQRLHGRSEYEGTGIGLANVRRIIERHGGTVRAESEGENKGACFYFTMPKREKN
jgi:PAS domain S-box-containing protein